MVITAGPGHQVLEPVKAYESAKEEAAVIRGEVHVHEGHNHDHGEHHHDGHAHKPKQIQGLGKYLSRFLTGRPLTAPEVKPKGAHEGHEHDHHSHAHDHEGHRGHAHKTHDHGDHTGEASTQVKATNTTKATPKNSGGFCALLPSPFTGQVIHEDPHAGHDHDDTTPPCPALLPFNGSSPPKEGKNGANNWTPDKYKLKK